MGHGDQINPIKDTEFISRIYMVPISPNTGLKSHLRDHELGNNTRGHYKLCEELGFGSHLIKI